MRARARATYTFKFFCKKVIFKIFYCVKKFRKATSKLMLYVPITSKIHYTYINHMEILFLSFLFSPSLSLSLSLSLSFSLSSFYKFYSRNSFTLTHIVLHRQHEERQKFTSRKPMLKTKDIIMVGNNIFMNLLCVGQPPSFDKKILLIL